MSKTGDFWNAHTDTDGQIIWPEDQAKRDVLARQLFGACFIDSLDYWLARADDLIDNPDAPQEQWRRSNEEIALRATFAAMTEEQRAAVRRIVRQTAQGTLFSSLVNIDQNPKEQLV
ncbi:MAG: hypothetical protein ACTHN5_23065 [Phycisphaerae bacterium]